jgi:hypothetical protein
MGLFGWVNCCWYSPAQLLFVLGLAGVKGNFVCFMTLGVVSLLFSSEGVKDVARHVAR